MKKKRLLCLRFVTLFISWMLVSSAAIGQSFDDVTMDGVVRVKLSPTVVNSKMGMATSMHNGVVTTGVQAFDNVSKVLSAVEMERVIPYNARYDERHRKHGLHLWYEIKYTSDVSPFEAVLNYKGVSGVEKAEPVFKKELIAGSIIDKPVPAEVYSTNSTIPFNDPGLGEQWHYNNTGDNSTEAIAGADINLFKAWEIETGKPNVIVSIVDGGFQTNHQDLEDNVWINEAELNGEEGVDDDGNGYIDDINGYNFVERNGTISQHYHGTHVAGTVAAVNNNAVGVAGVAGGSGNNDGVRIQSAQIFTDNGSTSNVAAGIIYGADNGAVISQNSWGYTTAGGYEQVVLDAIDYFVEEAGNYEGSPMKGGVVIFAAGNSGLDGEFYPGYYDKTIAVSSIKPNNEIASYSNYGTWVDVASYGGDIDVAENAAVLSTYLNNSYVWMDGTSMACPHVSGIAALVVSKHGGSDFTNEDLKKHLLTGVREVDMYNPDYEGKLGLGILDAALALATDEGKAPASIQDLTVLGLGQDFADITWSVPTDEDDDQPAKFKVYYHTDSITSDNVLQARNVELKNLSNAGEEFAYTLENLDATTKYYFAVTSEDRWGNVSDLSLVVNGTTNHGPDINADTDELDVSADASVSAVGSSSFNILNEDEGVLEWEGLIRHTGHRFAYNANGLSYPTAKTIAPAQANIQSHYLFGAHRTVKNLPLQEDENKLDLMANYDAFDYVGYNSTIVIGEEDTTYTNSSATRYYVSQEEGFNLTKVEMMIQHLPSTGPFIMEIYEGEQIHQDSIVYAAELTSYNSDPYWHNIYLDEQLYFTQGTTFWIVIHMPSGNLYPLGMARELLSEYSDNCYMSLDMGTTWLPLETLIADENYAWTTTAISQNKHMGDYITLSPSSGKVNGFESQKVDVDIDGTYLINGSYQSNILLASNDKDEKEYRIPVSFELTGQKAELVHDKVIDFGSVFHGRSKELTFTVENVGYGNFYRLNSVSSDDQFEVIDDPYSLSARSSDEFTVLYTPDGPGNDNSTLTLTDNYGNTHTISLFGVGMNPPEMEVTPLLQDVGTLNIGDDATATVTIKNQGEYPLEFALPSFASDIDIEGLANIHKFGYSYESNTDASVTYYWNDITSDGVDLTEYFIDINNSKYYNLDLGFDFPFYGLNVSQLNLTNAGVLALDQNSPFANCSPPKADEGCSPAGFISASNMEFDLNKSGSIHYKREAGKFIIQYTNVVLEKSYDITDLVTFQIVLFYNGDIDFIFKEIEEMDSYSLRSIQIGVGDINYADPFLINGRYDYDNRIEYMLSEDETIFRLKSPGQKLVKEVSSAQGIINPGDSVNIELTINTENLYEGTMFQKLAVVSNDPYNSLEIFEINANVIGGTPNVVLLTEDIELGSVYQGGILNSVGVIKNDGSKDVDITSVSVNTSNFIIDADVPFTLKAKSSYFVNVNLVTDTKGEFTDVLTFETSEGNTYLVNLSGEVTAAPGINIDTTPITASLNAGEAITKTIEIENDGEVDLEFITSGSDWLYVNEVSAMNAEVPDFTYASTDSYDEGGPIYVWEDILDEADGNANATWFMENNNFWFPVELPFEFTFYEQPTDKIWISWEGVITCQETDYAPEFMFAQSMPNEAEPNAIIAPMFTPNQESIYPGDEGYEEVGIFYKFYDDRVVITWSKYIDMFWMGSPYSFQAILYKNGNIKFQYSANLTSQLSQGVIGVENHDGTEAVQKAAYQKYAEDKLAVSFVPASKTTVPAGEKISVEVKLDASYLNKGEYITDFTIVSNAPQEEEVNIPITFTVAGEPNLSTIETVNFEDVVAYTVEGDWGAEPVSYTKDFAVKNDGRDDLMFGAIALQDGTDAQVFMKVVDAIWGTVYWSEINVWNVPTLEPGEYIDLRVQIAPAMNEFEIKDTIVFVSNLTSGDFELPVYANVKLPGVFECSTDTISYLASTPESEGVKTFKISNKEGLSSLAYNVGFNFRRAGVETDEEVSSSTTETFSLNELLKEVNDEATPSISTYADEFNRVLEYEQEDMAGGALGYGEDAALITATAFEAPVEGFNLTHVKTWYRYAPVLESTINVEVRAGGTNIAEAQVLTSQDFEIKLDANDTTTLGEFFTFELEESQLFYPGEEFYVVLTYDLGVPFPQGASKNVDYAEGRYLLKYQGQWLDLQSDSDYESTGWKVKACEETAMEAGWAILDGENSGEVASGDSVELSIKFYGNRALEADNHAEMVISTNDPMNPEEIVPLYLRLNQGPQYYMIDEDELIVNENDTLTIQYIIKDVEENDCTYELDGLYDDVNMSVSNDTLTLVYSPNYESAGVNTITVIGKDSYDNISNLITEVTVKNVNRAPEVIMPIADKVYEMPDQSGYIHFEDVFSDPDGQAMTYKVSVETSDIVEPLVSSDNVMFEPINTGTTQVVVKAIDEEGAFIEESFNVQVIWRIGIDDTEFNAQVKIYPNPVSSILNVVMSEDTNEAVKVRITNVAGSLVSETNFDSYSGDVLQVEMSQLISGVYFVEISTVGKTAVKKVIKK